MADTNTKVMTLRSLRTREDPSRSLVMYVCPRAMAKMCTILHLKAVYVSHFTEMEWLVFLIQMFEIDLSHKSKPAFLTIGILPASIRHNAARSQAGLLQVVTASSNLACRKQKQVGTARMGAPCHFLLSRCILNAPKPRPYRSTAHCNMTTCASLMFPSGHK